jgi:hypothetical protein
MLRPIPKARAGTWFSPFGWYPVRSVWALPGHAIRGARGAYDGWLKSRLEQKRREEVYAETMRAIALSKSILRERELAATARVMGHEAPPAARA